MTGPSHHFVIAVTDFDGSLLPADARTPGTDAFAAEVSKLLRAEYESFGGSARIVVSASEIEVAWTEGLVDPVESALGELAAGDYGSGVTKLRALLRQTPDDPVVLYNLGMALSDLGELDEAISLLTRVVKRAPDHVNALVGLGVAQQRARRTEDAIQSLVKAVALDPENPWAHRNLGACRLSQGEGAEAKTHLARAVELLPDDQPSWLGLGQASESLGDPATADECYVKVIEIDRDSPVAEQAKQRRSALGQQQMRARVDGGIRPDAMMYCLGALEKLSKMEKEEVKKCAVEIAMRGQNGFDFNDSTPKYQFKTLEGNFSGLQALAYMYVSFKYVMPDADIGFDLSREYAAAKSIFAGDAP